MIVHSIRYGVGVVLLKAHHIRFIYFHVKTQSLREVLVEDSDYQVIFAAMTRVSEFSGHDMAAGRQIPIPDLADMRRDLDQLDNYRVQIHGRKRVLQQRRGALEEPPVAAVV
jgi:hypothetical protein